MAHILVLNAGSSSLKFGLFTAEKAPQPLATGLVDRIGGPAHMRLRSHDGGILCDAAVPAAQAADHAGALAAAFHHVGQHFAQAHIVAVGHRIVHGGRDFVAPVVLGASEMQALAALVPFAPLHQPHNLAGVRAAMALLPDAVQIGCFDTAFHRHHPFVNDTFALPRDYYEKGVRRYGFHGLSYDYIAGALADMAPTLHAGRVVVAHLGNGASMCALQAGRSVASSMGFSALDGLPMAPVRGRWTRACCSI
jgi:acetate kinase